MTPPEAAVAAGRPAAGRAGYIDIGEQTLELHPADGHTADGMAVWVPWARVLVAGDYLSPVEIPMIAEGGSVAAYLATLNRLEPLVEQADHVVPGHGGPIDAQPRWRSCARTAPTSKALPRGDDARPLARRTKAQRAIHEERTCALTTLISGMPASASRTPTRCTGCRRSCRRK